MRTAEHMEHRNLERKWRPSFVLGPHLTEGRLKYERRSCRRRRRIVGWCAAIRVWTVRGRIAPCEQRPLGLKNSTTYCYDATYVSRFSRDGAAEPLHSCERSYSRRSIAFSVARGSSTGPAGQGVRRAAIVVTPGVSTRTTAF